MRLLPGMSRITRGVLLCMCAWTLLAPGIAQQYTAPPAPPAGSGAAVARWVTPVFNVTTLAVTADGAYAAVPQGFGLIAIYRMSDGACTRILSGHAAKVNGVAISADGSLLASGDVNGEVRLWQLSNGTCLRTCNCDSAVNSIAFSPDGQQLVTAHADGVARQWLVSNGTLVRSLTGHTGAVLTVAYTPNGQMIATGSSDSTIKLWQTNDGTCVCTLTGHLSNVLSLAFSPDGTKLASGGLDMSLRLWQVSSGELLRTANLSTFYPDSLAFSPDGILLACGASDGTVQLMQVGDGTTVRTLSGHTGEVHGLAFLGNGQTLLSGASDNLLKVWQVNTGTVARTITAPNALSTSVAISPDGQLLAAASLIGTVAIRRVSDGTLVRTLAGVGNSIVSGTAFSPDGQTLATCSYDKTARVWRVSDGKLLLTLSGHTDALRHVLFTKDGQTLITASYDTTIKCWRVSDGTLLQTIPGGTDALYALAFSPDGQTLAVGSGDATIKFFRISDGASLSTLTGPISYITALAYAPDGQTLASASGDGTINLWQTSDGACLRTLVSAFPQVNALAFSPDGSTLAEANYNQYIACWRVRDGCLQWAQRGVNFTVNDIAYLPDGSGLAMAGQDGVALWRAQDSQPDLQIRRIADTTYLGAGIYNQPAMQTVNTTIPAMTAGYAVKLVNAGQADMTYLLRAPTADSGWTVRYYDALTSGNDITLPITMSPGWAVTLTPSQTRELRVEVTPADGLPDPSNNQLQISANSLQYSDDVCASTTLHKELANLSLSALPTAPQLINAPITLTATSTGGTGVGYKFFAGYQDTAGWHWEALTDYQSTAACTWKPSNAHLYTLKVYAREQGSATAYDVMCTAVYRILSSLSAVKLTTAPVAPQAINTSLTLIATSTASFDVEYKFRAGYQDAAGWHWNDLTDYQTTATCTWTPSVPRLYTLVAWVREHGSTKMYDVLGTLVYRVTPPPITAVTLDTTPTAPQSIGMPITLTAQATGGYSVEYKFSAGYQDAGGWHWSALTTYQPAPTCTWTPADARLYTLVVYIREVGSTVGYNKYTTLTYRVTQ